MKKKDLIQLTVRQLIEELRAKAGGVINAGYRVETREEYRQYLNEILDELQSRDLSDEEQEELKKLLVVDDSTDEDDSDEDDSNEDDSNEDDSDKDDSDKDDSNEDDSDKDDSDEDDSDEDDSDEDDSDEDDSDEDDSDEDDSDEDDSDKDDSNEDDSDEDDSDEDDSDEDDSDEDDSDEDDSDEDDSDEDDSDGDDSDEDDSDEDDSDEDDSDEDDSDEDDSDKDDSNEDDSDEDDSTESGSNNDRKPAWLIWIPWLMASLAIIIALIALLSRCDGSSNGPVKDPVDDEPGISVGQPEDPSVSAFDMDAFTTAVVNIAGQFTDEDDIAANADIFVGNIGEDKLIELIGKYGELQVQKNIAQLMVFAPEVKMMQYVLNNNLNYNQNAADDYDAKLNAADEAYRAATGKNPDGALMSLEGYDIHKSNRDAMKALIVESGDLALLTWYTVKTEEYDVMKQQQRDTATAEEYKQEVKLELVNSAGTIKLLELQLEKVANGTLKVMDDVTLEYTDSYEAFILSNYMYVIATP